MKAATPEPAERGWADEVFRRSLTKQAKLREIAALLGPVRAGQVCLDIGGDNGIISLHLRRLGGTWYSADGSDKAVASIRQLVGERVERLEGSRLSFPDAHFDVLVITDYLEHVADDQQLIAECHRVLKPSGRLIVNVPHAKALAVLPPVRRLLGLADEQHGHVRPGYTEAQLFAVLKDGFDVREARTYSRFFVEALDTLVRLASRRAQRGQTSDAKGAMLDEQDFQKLRKTFRAYAVLYPFFRLAAVLDGLLFFTQGYSLIVSAARRPWRPRVVPALRDGRSIAEAALQSKIGTAAPF